MRRSYAPSQRLSINSTNYQTNNTINNEKQNMKMKDSDKENEITISTLPLFSFLEIPSNLNKQFKIPSGCKITEESVALRKVKTLGPSKCISILRPGQLSHVFLPKSDSYSDSLDDDGEELPTRISNNNLPDFEPLVLWVDNNNSDNTISVIPELCSKLRPHQREGVKFLFECTMGLRDFIGYGCILADDMGLGKTFMSITLMWTLMNQGFNLSSSAVRKVIVACPTSLVGNWEKEIDRWLNQKCQVFAVKSEPKIIIRNFLQYKGKGVLIISYDTQRRYSSLFELAHKGSTNKIKKIIKNSTNIPDNITSNIDSSIDNKLQSADKDDIKLGDNIDSKEDNQIPEDIYNGVCELLICDEAHKLKNADSGIAQSLNKLPAKRRILLSGTPMQNELLEFYNMVNFCNPSILGTTSEFRKRYERPILRAREPDSSSHEQSKAKELQTELSTIVNKFILKRGNILNAKHLPTKLTIYVCCRLTDIQEKMYLGLLDSKEVRYIRDGKQINTLNSIRQLINICSHPQLILETYKQKLANKEKIDEDLNKLINLLDNEIKSTSISTHTTNHLSNQLTNKLSNKSTSYLNIEFSGKLIVLHRLMTAMRASKLNERIVIVSNYTSTLDLIEQMCRQETWPVLRLDGTTSGSTRTKLVDKFNDPKSISFAFLLSSKAGGCGINLIGGNRLVLFDPDWNPASDKQAAGRIWREGQIRRCYIYRFMSTGTIEEKIIQRQLSKEGLQNIVDNTDQVNQISTEELRRLFQYRGSSTRSDTHDTLKCKRCTKTICINKPIASNSLSDHQINLLTAFISNYLIILREKSLSINQIELPNFIVDQIDKLNQELVDGNYTSIFQFSKKIRQIVTQIDRNPYESLVDKPIDVNEDIQSDNIIDSTVVTDNKIDISKLKPIRIYEEFVSLWSEISNQLTNNPSREADRQEENDVNNDVNEWVEQIGCPDETDFNNWSHHSSINSCDDEILKKAMAADNTISFAFGLEINFQLLELKEKMKLEAKLLNISFDKENNDMVNIIEKVNKSNQKANNKNDKNIKKKNNRNKKDSSKKESNKKDGKPISSNKTYDETDMNDIFSSDSDICNTQINKSTIDIETDSDSELVKIPSISISKQIEILSDIESDSCSFTFPNKVTTNHVPKVNKRPINAKTTNKIISNKEKLDQQIILLSDDDLDVSYKNDNKNNQIVKKRKIIMDDDDD